MAIKSVAVTASGVTGLRYNLKGWYFSETGGTSTFTVTIRVGDAAGPILWKHTIRAGGSVGEDLDEAIDLRMYSGTNDVYVDITGAGTCQGAVRGR